MRSFAIGLSLVVVTLLAARVPAVDADIDRRPAGVMSYFGADWLERSTRAEEEDPDQLMAQLGLQSGDVVADLGCGSGYYTRRLSHAVGQTGRVYAVDIQPEMLEIAERGLVREGIENVTLVQSTETDPKLPPGEIDWILLVDVYHEFQQPEPMLAAMHRALAPDGRIALAEFRLEGKSAQHIKLEHRMSVEQVLAEWEPAGFELVTLYEELPTQHLFVFRKAEGESVEAGSAACPVPFETLVYEERTVESVRGSIELGGEYLGSGDAVPLEGATVTLYERDSDSRVAEVLTSSSGEFLVSDVAPGSYRLTVCKGGFNSIEVPLRVWPGSALASDSLVLETTLGT